MKLYIVDAFTEELFGGNPAGVVILDGDFLSDEVMIKTAAELRYSETAFIKNLGNGEFEIRYFTPAAEVELCGHATIASFVVLQEEGLCKADGSYINHTKAGKLKVKTKNGSVLMEMGEPKIVDTIESEEALKELYGIMGLSDHKPHTAKLLPQMASTGLTDIMMPVCDTEALAAIKPDFPALAALSDRYGVVGVHAFCPPAQGEAAGGITAHCRNFAPLYDIDEEAATGTSNGALTYYMYKNGMIKDGADCLFIQGEAMERPSAIRSHIEGSEIMVGGSACILAKGEIFIK